MGTILIADDELTSVKQLFNEIIERNTNIKLIGIANNGKEVLEFINKEQPDILLLDLMMPKMNGIQVLNELINKNKIHEIKTKIIIISGYIEELYNSNKYRNYIYAVMPKPYNINKLIQIINNIINEIEDENMEKYIQQQLQIFNFNESTNSYKYLKQTIYELIINYNMNIKNIYTKVARINNKKSWIQIKWGIEKLMDSMYLNTKFDVIRKYFGFEEDIKPTTKTFISHIVDNYNNKRLS